jgi:adenylate cyclase
LIYQFEDYRLDGDRQELRRGTARVDVEPQVLDLLQYIIRNRERVVSKDDLIEHVWHGRIVSDSTLTSRITTARQAIGDSGDQQRLIRTIARKGIRFVGEVREQSAPNDNVASTGQFVSGAVPRLPDKPSIAVLPFENMSADPEQQFFADGIAEDIITALSRYPSLFVIARNSSFTFKGRAVDVKQVGRELGVRYVLEGSLRKSGKSVRVTAQLIEAETSNHVWAERYDRNLADIFVVQDEITQATTIAIAPAVAGAEQQRAMRKPPASLDAWGAYQRGLWHLSKASDEDNVLARTLFQQAIDIDPMFAGGYIGLSAVLARAKGTQSEEEALARRAVALDGGNAEAHARLALALLARGDHQGASDEAEQALTVCPNLAAAHGALGVVLAYSGRPREGLAALNTCIRLDPRAPTLVNRLNQIALTHYFCRDYEAAAEAAERAIRAFPDFPSPYRWLAAALGELGRTAAAKEALEKAILVSPTEFDFQVRKRPPWFRPDEHARMLEGLRKAGWQG